jgi:hypothetical protein
MKFSPEEIAMLAEAERMMDAGRIPFVMWQGERVMVPAETMHELGLRQKQTINKEIFMAICHCNLAYIQAQRALLQAAKGQSRK